MENPLPDSVSELQSLVAEVHHKLVGTEREKDRVEHENNILREQIRLLRHQLYGRKSEKLTSPEEMGRLLFPELFEQQDTTQETPQEEVEVKPHTRAKTGRKPFPEDLPRHRVEHDIPEEEKVCGCGARMDCIGEESSEQLDIVPATVQVIQHVRFKYACSHCHGEQSDEKAVKIAPPPAQILPKCMVSPGMLAHIMTGKFTDALPFHRQENMLSRYGVEVSRASMCNWAMALYERCLPLAELLELSALDGEMLGIDETTVSFLGGKKDKKQKANSAYMWVIRGGPPEKPVVSFRFAASRAQSVPMELLSGYQGIVMSDGYAGYKFLDQDKLIIHAGCWAHARRLFHDVNKGLKKGHSDRYADHALKVIKELYAIESEVKGQAPELIQAARQEKAKPVLDAFARWLNEHGHRFAPKTNLGKAFGYSLSQLPKLLRYLEDGRIPIDNNPTENAIRPFVVGRKNWLFVNSLKGARASAFFYSLIETAKANGLEPFSYLTTLFERYPLAHTLEDLEALLPQNIDRTGINTL